MLKMTTVNSNGKEEETLLEFNGTELDSFLSLLNDAKKVNAEHDHLRFDYLKDNMTNDN